MAVYHAILGWLPAAWSQELFIKSEDNVTYEVPVESMLGQCLWVLSEERWERYCDPVTERCWYWYPAHVSCFGPDVAHKEWKPYCTDDRRRWWWNDQTYACFYDDLAIARAIDSVQGLVATEPR